MTLLALVSFLKRVPAWVYATMCAVVVVVALTASVTHYGSQRFAAGRASVLDSMTHVMADSLRWERTRHEAALAAAQGRTDTLVRVVKGRTDTLFQTLTALSPDIRQHPQVQALVTQCTALAQDCEKMRNAFHEERLRSDSLRAVLIAQTDKAASLVVAQRDTITALAKRPTRKTAALVALLGIGAGFLGGVTR